MNMLTDWAGNKITVETPLTDDPPIAHLSKPYEI